MKTRDLHEALTIILRHEPAATVATGHDVIYCGRADMPLTDEERERLDALGWSEDVRLDTWVAFT